jgi:hypothetical protein
MKAPTALILASTVVLAACTGDRADGSGRASGTSPTATASAEPGTYVYDFNGVRATFRLHGSSGSIDIRNGTGSRLAPPRLSILAAADGAELDAELGGAGPLGRGDRRTFGVSLDQPVHPRDVGLVVLSFGTDVWGALSPGRADG